MATFITVPPPGRIIWIVEDIILEEGIQSLVLYVIIFELMLIL